MAMKNETTIDVCPDVLTEVGWNEYTTLETVFDGGKIKIVQKTEWSVDEAQVYFEKIMADVEYNGTTHFITDSEGHRCALTPYSDELKTLLDAINK